MTLTLYPEVYVQALSLVLLGEMRNSCSTVQYLSPQSSKMLLGKY